MPEISSGSGKECSPCDHLPQDIIPSSSTTPDATRAICRCIAAVWICADAPDAAIAVLSCTRQQQRHAAVLACMGSCCFLHGLEGYSLNPVLMALQLTLQLEARAM
jgi:hypothetical protein